MKFGVFSVSLAVKYLQKSLDFHQILGFAHFAGVLLPGERDGLTTERF